MKIFKAIKTQNPRTNPSHWSSSINKTHHPKPSKGSTFTKI